MITAKVSFPNIIPKKHIFSTFVDNQKNTPMLRIIATFILIYLIFRIMIFFVFPKIGQWYLNRHRNKFYKNNPAAARARERREKQKMHVSQSGQKNTNDTDNIGEYVDFEEIKDSSQDKQSNDK